MTSGIRTSTEREGHFVTAKRILLTLFLGFAAAHSEGKIIQEKMFTVIGQYVWYSEFLYFSQFIYGVFSGGLFYLLILKKASHRLGRQDNQSTRRLP